jgi:hypothetical protein
MPPTIKRGATTLSRMTLVRTMFSIKSLFVTHNITTLCYYAERHYAECRILFIVKLNVIMLSAVLLIVVMLNVVMLNVLLMSVVMLSFVTMNVINNAVR